MTGGHWRNAVTRTGDKFRGAVMRTTGGSRVDVKRCPHRHDTWIEARACAAEMECFERMEREQPR